MYSSKFETLTRLTIQIIKLLNTERNCKICLEQYDFKSFCDVELLFYERVKIQVHVAHTFLSVNLSVMGRMKQF